MKQTVMLRLQGRQLYEEQEPEVIELVTEGTLERLTDGWRICYEESDLTGLEGVTTIFRVQSDRIVLTRKGRLDSQMVFQTGVLHESLYQMEFGALMITVCATKIDWTITEQGGFVDLVYGIDIEHSAGGVVEYHLDIEAK